MNKYDLSDRAHQEPRKFKIGKITRLLIGSGGGQPDKVFEVCTAKEIADFKARGAVLLGSSALTTVTATIVFHLAFGDSNPILLVLAGAGIGALQGTIDCFVQYRGSLLPQGLAELRNAGLKLPAPGRSLTVSTGVRIFRVIQGATLGFLGGLVFTVAANSTDIRAYIDEKFMIDNGAVAVESAKLVDASIARSKEALALETSELNNLSRAIQSLRANDVRRAIGASRKTNRLSAPASDVQLTALESRLTDETAKRDVLKAAVDTQETGRNAAIEASVANAPHHIPKRIGLAAQLAGLSAITREDPKLLLLIFAFELISLALELGPMFCAATYVPSAYAARVVLEHFEEVTKLASASAERLGARRDDPPAVDALDSAAPIPDTAPAEANDNSLNMAALNGVMPARRGRGRPRKNGLDHMNGSADHV
jgi:hypothetical protein